MNTFPEPLSLYIQFGKERNASLSTRRYAHPEVRNSREANQRIDSLFQEQSNFWSLESHALYEVATAYFKRQEPRRRRIWRIKETNPISPTTPQSQCNPSPKNPIPSISRPLTKSSSFSLPKQQQQQPHFPIAPSFHQLPSSSFLPHYHHFSQHRELAQLNASPLSSNPYVPSTAKPQLQSTQLQRR